MTIYLVSDPEFKLLLGHQRLTGGHKILRPRHTKPKQKLHVGLNIKHPADDVADCLAGIRGIMLDCSVLISVVEKYLARSHFLRGVFFTETPFQSCEEFYEKKKLDKKIYPESFDNF